jgi:hypothetical protein
MEIRNNHGELIGEINNSFTDDFVLRHFRGPFGLGSDLD